MLLKVEVVESGVIDKVRLEEESLIRIQSELRTTKRNLVDNDKEEQVAPQQN